ncbi:MAG: rRNA maturation RNase YbeY [Candidatus Magasanikbacteria bacterium]|nr:rRNA maturation RNase YbeY [Candidatus Magasanikbacteria bacterium]
MVHIFKTVRTVDISRKEIEAVVFAVLSRIGRKGEDVSVHCIGDRRSQTLNRHYRGKDKPTDVLSFAASEGKALKRGLSGDLGDIFICIPQIRRQARQYGISSQEEMIRMLAHGVLHLAGHDHLREREAKIMFGIQEEIVRKFL